jgi:hypothetical protein
MGWQARNRFWGHLSEMPVTRTDFPERVHGPRVAQVTIGNFSLMRIAFGLLDLPSTNPQPMH